MMMIPSRPCSTEATLLNMEIMRWRVIKVEFKKRIKKLFHSRF